MNAVTSTEEGKNQGDFEGWQNSDKLFDGISLNTSFSMQ